MRRRTTPVATAALLIAALAGRVDGQEGYPLDGTWRGEWGGQPAASTAEEAADSPAGASAGNHVVMVMKWDGTTINGRINPGPSSIPFTSAALDPGDWTVRIEATARSGEPIVIEGRLRDIGSYDRYIEGTWTQAGTAYRLRIERQ